MKYKVKKLITSKVSCIIVPMIFLFLFQYIFFRIFIDFEAKTKKVNFSEIESTQIINLPTSSERRNRYERMLHIDFDGMIFNTYVKDATMPATHGKEDLVFLEIGKDEQAIKRIDADEIADGYYQLKEKQKYKIYDKRDPSIYFYYEYNPEKIYWQKRHMRLGEFGCIMSHIRAINNVANGEKQYNAIFEDDFVLEADFNNKVKEVLSKAPEDFGILKLDGVHNKKGKHRVAWLRSRLINGYNEYFYNATSDHGKVGMTTSYIITKDYARKIMNFIKKVPLNGADGTADVFLFMILPRKYQFDDIWIVKDFLVYQNSDFVKSGSDIGKINNN